MSTSKEVTFTFNKPWMPALFQAISGLPPTEQSIALWMAFIANADGHVDNFTWAELAELSGLQPDSLRKIMKKELALYEEGILHRQPRRYGNVNAIPLFTLNIADFYGAEEAA